MKTNLGLVEYCKKQLGLPYWWGTFGQVATKTLYEQKKVQYPTQYLDTDFKYQFGKKVHDCVGLIKGYLWTNENGKIVYNPNQDKDVTGMLSNCYEIGSIATIPEIPGILVFMKGHVGVYIGNGEVIEAKGHKYGVVKTKLKDRPWDTYGKLDWLEYETESEDNPMLDGKIITMITNLCDKYGENNVEKALTRLIETYIDDGNPAPWAMKEVEEAKQLAITDGNNPEMFATRQEVMMMCLRTYKKIKEEK